MLNVQTSYGHDCLYRRFEIEKKHSLIILTPRKGIIFAIFYIAILDFHVKHARIFTLLTSTSTDSKTAQIILRSVQDTSLHRHSETLNVTFVKIGWIKDIYMVGTGFILIRVFLQKN
jgi:hypothetical protein